MLNISHVLFGGKTFENCFSLSGVSYEAVGKPLIINQAGDQKKDHWQFYLPSEFNTYNLYYKYKYNLCGKCYEKRIEYKYINQV